MAQLGGAQREPSMEEILASIRRIIEDSDPVRRPDNAVQPGRPDNDTVSSVAGPVSTPMSRAGSDASVIAVDAFRAGPRFDDTAAAQRRESPAMTPARMQPAAERVEARTVAERNIARTGSSAPKAEADQSGAAGSRQAVTSKRR